MINSKSTTEQRPATFCRSVYGEPNGSLGMPRENEAHRITPAGFFRYRGFVRPGGAESPITLRPVGNLEGVLDVVGVVFLTGFGGGNFFVVIC